MAHILVADDDRHIREVVCFALEQAGHQVTEAEDGGAAWAVFERGGLDVLVLDVLMPGEDGLSLCRRVRAQSRIPIIFLSSRDEEIDRVLGLELGGDDYMTKPFGVRELVSRVGVVLRRLQQDATPMPPMMAPGAAPQIIRHGALQIDPARHLCSWKGEAIVLTVTEFALLEALARRPGIVFSREELVAQAYGNDHFITDRTVDSHIRRLRKKLSEHGLDPVETVYGIGYKLAELGGG